MSYDLSFNREMINTFFMTTDYDASNQKYRNEEIESKEILLNIQDKARSKDQIKDIQR